jgi:hypothetical protein
MAYAYVKDRHSYHVAAITIQLLRNITGILDLEGVIDRTDPYLYVLFTLFLLGYLQLFFMVVKPSKHIYKIELIMCLYVSVSFTNGFGSINFDSPTETLTSIGRVIMGLTSCELVLKF